MPRVTYLLGSIETSGIPLRFSGNRKPETGNRKPETGNRKPETRNRKPETGNRKPETGNQGNDDSKCLRHEICSACPRIVRPAGLVATGLADDLRHGGAGRGEVRAQRDLDSRCRAGHRPGLQLRFLRLRQTGVLQGISVRGNGLLRAGQNAGGRAVLLSLARSQRAGPVAESRTRNRPPPDRLAGGEGAARDPGFPLRLLFQQLLQPGARRAGFRTGRCVVRVFETVTGQRRLSYPYPPPGAGRLSAVSRYRGGPRADGGQKAISLGRNVSAHGSGRDGRGDEYHDARRQGAAAGGRRPHALRIHARGAARIAGLSRDGFRWTESGEHWSDRFARALFPTPFAAPSGCARLDRLQRTRRWAVAVPVAFHGARGGLAQRKPAVAESACSAPVAFPRQHGRARCGTADGRRSGRRVGAQAASGRAMELRHNAVACPGTDRAALDLVSGISPKPLKKAKSGRLSDLTDRSEAKFSWGQIFRSFEANSGPV